MNSIILANMDHDHSGHSMPMPMPDHGSDGAMRMCSVSRLLLKLRSAVLWQGGLC